MGRPKKQPIVDKPKKEKKVKPKVITLPSGVHIKSDENNSIDNLKIINPSNYVQSGISRLIDKRELYAKYKEKCNDTESDIYYHLPKLYEIATECEHCTEFGVRQPTSTWALLAANPKRVVSYDISRWDDVDEVEKICAEENQYFQFITLNVLEAEIEQTDLLLIDSYHSFNQATAELAKHAHKVNKYIIFHDTAEYAYRWKSEAWYPGVADNMNDPIGLYPAIENFIKENPNWIIDFETEINNGLTVLKRK